MADRNRLESGRRETYRGFESRPLCQMDQWSMKCLFRATEFEGDGV